MVIYNMSFMDNSTNILHLATGIGNSMGQEFLIGYMILVSFFLVFMILSVRFDFNEILIVDGFLTTVLSILLYTAGMVQPHTIVYPAVITIIGLLVYLFVNK